MSPRWCPDRRRRDTRSRTASDPLRGWWRARNSGRSVRASTCLGQIRPGCPSRTTSGWPWGRSTRASSDCPDGVLRTKTRPSRGQASDLPGARSPGRWRPPRAVRPPRRGRSSEPVTVSLTGVSPGWAAPMLAAGEWPAVAHCGCAPCAGRGRLRPGRRPPRRGHARVRPRWHRRPARPAPRSAPWRTPRRSGTCRREIWPVPWRIPRSRRRRSQGATASAAAGEPTGGPLSGRGRCCGGTAARCSAS